MKVLNIVGLIMFTSLVMVMFAYMMISFNIIDESLVYILVSSITVLFIAYYIDVC